ncbi:MAG TPA: biotin/lipoyl-binding protein, partial [Nevskiaceae bacterium]|nr:biotin/lipoyl-binding protein [Nevskiaceae bacterium]
MTAVMFVSRYLLFDSGTRTLSQDGDDTEVGASGNGRPIRLARRDLEIAKLFDGQRDAAARVAAARALGHNVTEEALEGFANELTLAGLLRAGSHEPLPVPTQSDEEARQLGWRGAPRRLPGSAGGQNLAPSTVPGSRNNPALSGGLGGLVTGKRGEPNRFLVALPSAPFAWTGRLIAWPLANRWTLAILLGLLAACVYAVLTHRAAWVLHLEAMYDGFRFVPPIVLGALLINLFATAARAAAIERCTPERARLGIVLGLFGFPRLFVDTAGAAERATRADRVRIAGAGLTGSAMLLVLCVVLWFLSHTTAPVVANYCTNVGLLVAVVIVLRLNPIAQQDGYFILGNAINHLDLRLQATTVLFGFERPWNYQARRIPNSTLLGFFAIVVVYWIVLLTVLFTFAGDWLVKHFGGLGFLALVAFLALFVVRQYQRSGALRNNLGRSDAGWKTWLPGRRGWIAIGVVAALCLVPYPYEPGGEFTVLPRDRADVRALIDGDVREVLVQEGDLVKAGQPIVRLDDAVAKARLAEAKAALAVQQAELRLAQKGARSEAVALARQRVDTARAASALAQRQLRITTTAWRGKDASAAEYERVRGAADVAAGNLQLAQRAYEEVAAPVRDERIRELEATIAEAQALVDWRQTEVEQTTLVAPIAGRVVSDRLAFARGTFLARGDLLAQVEDVGERLAEIALPE